MFHLEPMSSSSNGTFSFCKSKVVEGEDLSFRIIGCVRNLAIKKKKGFIWIFMQFNWKLLYFKEINLVRA